MKIKDSIFFVLFLMVVALLNASPAFSDGQMEAKTAYIEPDGVMQIEWMSEPPMLTPQQKAQLESFEFNRPGPPIPISSEPIAPPIPGTESRNTGAGNTDPLATSAPQIWLTRDLVNVDPSGYTSNVAEPAAANVGKYVFYAANWFAARSSNQGVSWTYVNPFSGFSDFCCDQDVIYDKSYDLMIWLRMGIPDGNGENRFMVGVSNNGGQSFWTYTISTIGSNTGEWYDYPHFALTNNYLYMSWNMFNASNVYVRSRVMRWPLQPMSTASGFVYSFFDDTGGTITPAQGGTTKMYAGQHRSTSSLRVYTWQEFSGTYGWADRTVPAWTSGRTSCACTDGNNPCGRYDNRITAGYVKRHAALAFAQLETVGFFWTAAAGGGFPYTYVNNAWFYTNTMNYGGRANIWNPNYAFMYAAAHPDRRGNIGIVADAAGGTLGYTRVVAFKDDDTDGLPPGYTYSTVISGNACPSDNKWGDYNRVREFMPVGTCWLGTGHVLRGGTTGDYVHPVYFIFGNPRDYKSCYERWRQLG